jgi:ethanolamine utilization microcompartment shell protein EutS
MNFSNIVIFLSGIMRLLKNYGLDSTSPALGFVTVTPNDTTVFSPPLRAFRVGGAGNIAVVDINGVTTVIPSLQQSEQISGFIVQILYTGTTATGITGML